MLIITGMHRSGTTFLGRVMEQSGFYDYIHEPFSPRFGIEGVPHRYSYLDLEGCANEPLRHTLDDLHDLKMVFKLPRVEESFAKKAARRVIRSHGHLGLLKHRLTPWKKEVLFKDPFLSLCGGYLVKTFPEVKIIYAVRHPLALYRSIMRMGWQFDFADILAQPELVNRYGADFADKLATATTVPEQVAYLWKILYRVIDEQSRALGNKALVFKHEDFCEDPHARITSAFAFLGREIPEPVNRFINKKMFGGKVMPKGDTLHDFARNSKDLAWAWQKKYTPEYDVILEIIGADLQRFYPTPSGIGPRAGSTRPPQPVE